MLTAVGSRLRIFNRRLLPAIITLLTLVVSQNSHALDCQRYKDRIEHYEQLRHGGGKARQMGHWQTTIDDLEQKLKQCNSAGRIQVVSGATTKTTRSYVEAPAVTVRHTAQQLTNVVMVRKLKDCIKPNNVIDNDVSECMKGNLEPVWIR
jgi:hypothetical protein